MIVSSSNPRGSGMQCIQYGLRCTLHYNVRRYYECYADWLVSESGNACSRAVQLDRWQPLGDLVR